MSQKRSVLIAEDNIALNGIIRFNLSKAGFDVHSARNGKEGAERVESRRFDLIISDHQMPHLTGVELCELTRKSSLNADTPFVLLTAKALEIDKDQLWETLQIADVIQKPFSPAAIVQQIIDFLEQRCPEPTVTI